MQLGMIGSYDKTHRAVCGQSDKTELFLQALTEKVGEQNLRFVNTYNWKKNKIFSMVKIVWTVMTCRNIIIMTSINGTRLLYLFAKVAKKISHKKVFHIVIGGKKNIELIANNQKYLAVAKTLDGIYVEVPQMVEEYESLGIERVMYVPNCKKIVEQMPEVQERESAPYQFCVYSKVNREKGVPEAIDAVVKMNTELNIPCHLDVYGVIDKTYTEEFEQQLEKHSKYVRFCGKVDRAKSMEVLSQYYAMLFPTHHPEGIPGAMIDAYEAGLPIIASNSFYMDTIIKDGLTGILFDEHSENGLVEAMEKAVTQSQFILGMRKLCYEEAQKYSIKTTMEKLYEDMNLR